MTCRHKELRTATRSSERRSAKSKMAPALCGLPPGQIGMRTGDRTLKAGLPGMPAFLPLHKPRSNRASILGGPCCQHQTLRRRTQIWKLPAPQKKLCRLPDPKLERGWEILPPCSEPPEPTLKDVLHAVNKCNTLFPLSLCNLKLSRGHYPY